MKSIKKYITNQKLDDVLYEDIYNDLYNINEIYFTFNRDIHYIFENFKINKIKHVYNGCNELSEFILEKIKEHNSKLTKEKFLIQINKEELKNIQNIFFKEIFISVDIDRDKYKNPKANYEVWQDNIKEYKAFKYDEKENLFNFVNISVTLGEGYILTSDIFVHELIHAYEDYNLYSNKNNETLYSKLKETNYFDTINKLSNKIDKYEKFLYNLEYVLNPHEQNAFIAQLTQIINNKCKSIKGDDVKQLYEYIYKNDKLFMDFNNLYHNFKYFINHNREWELLCEKYNKINKTNLDKEHIYAKLSKKIYKFKNKLVNSILDTWSKFKYDGFIF